MSFLNLFRKVKQIPAEALPEDTEVPVPRSLFVEDRDLTNGYAKPSPGKELHGISVVYDFIRRDYEKQGYADAISLPDIQWMEANISLIFKDLMILIQKECLWYESELMNLNTHIQSRSRAGLLDIVQELNAKQECLNKEYAKLKEVGMNLADSIGEPLRIKLSYEKGFKKGLEAISRDRFLSGMQ